MKLSKLNLLLALLALVSIGVVGIVLLNQSEPTVAIGLQAISPTSEVNRFVSDVTYEDASTEYRTIMKMIESDTQTTQPEALKNQLAVSFASKTIDNIIRYCSNEEFSNKSYNKHKANYELVTAVYPEANELTQVGQLTTLVKEELSLSGRALWLGSALDKKINEHMALFSESYDWTTNHVRDWFYQSLADINNTRYVSQNPNLKNNLVEPSEELKAWSELTFNRYSSEYQELARIKTAYENKRYSKAINSFKVCEDFEVLGLYAKCKYYKDISFIKFMGCGVSGSDSIGSQADLECLKNKSNDCRFIKGDQLYWKRCLEFTTN